MKFKKLAPLILISIVIIASLFLYIITHSQEKLYSDYIDELERVFSWEKSNYNLKLNSIVDIETNDKKETEKHDIDINYDIDKKENKGEMDFILKTNKNDDIEKLKILFDKDNLYISKDYLNQFLEKNSFDKVITKEFGNAKFSQVYKEYYQLGFETFILIDDFIIKQSKNTEQFFKFLRKTNTKIDLELNKENNVYLFTWDENKLLDVTNEYVKHLLTNPDDFIEFLEIIFKVDFQNPFMYKEGLKEEIIESMPSFYKLWVTEVENNLPKYKEMLKGTRLSFEGKFEEDSYKSNYKLVLKIDKSKKYLFEEDKEEIEESDTAIYLPPYMPYLDLIIEDKQVNGIYIEINQKLTKSSYLNINMPTNYEDFDYYEILQSNLGKYTYDDEGPGYEEIPGPPSEKWERKLTKDNYVVKLTISPNKKTVIRETMYDITTDDAKKYDVDCTVKEGVLYIREDDIEKILNPYEFTEDDKNEYVAVRELFEKTFEQSIVEWDAKRHVVIVYL